MTVPMVLAVFLLGASSLTGRVVDAGGQPVNGARVFLEPGLEGAIVEAPIAADGAFRFENVAPGPVGVFAAAPGFGYAGKHLNLGLDEAVPPLVLRMPLADRVAGRVLTEKRKPIEGARITRIALLDADKVGIPITKLKAFGFEEPRTDGEGRFVLGQLPAGGIIALKVGHADYAQEGVADIAVGDEDVRVTLVPGVITEGLVLERRQEMAVANVDVWFQNAGPPHDTALTRSDGRGHFQVRLKPGSYLGHSAGNGYRSAGWMRFEVSPDAPQQMVRLLVARTGRVRGTIKDAITGAPVPGARVLLETNGNMAGLARTGATGEFVFETAEGLNLVRIEAAPGYFPPEINTVTATVLEGQDLELPGFWLAPLPEFDVLVLDADLNPAPGVIVSVLRPYQFGWRVTDAQGRVRIKAAVLPPDGRLIAMAEHPSAPLGALFALTRKDTQLARVQLLPLGRVSGQVVTAEQKPLAGAVVGGFLPGEKAEEEMLLWRCLSREDGRFDWDAVTPGVPQRCLIRAGETASAQSVTFNILPAGQQDLGMIAVAGGEAGASWLNQTVEWRDAMRLCGPAPGEYAGGRRMVLLYCTAAESEMVFAGLRDVERILAENGLGCAVLLDRPLLCESAPCPVLQGKPPASAATYVLDTEGRVVFESFGLPPLRAMKGP